MIRKLDIEFNKDCVTCKFVSAATCYGCGMIVLGTLKSIPNSNLPGKILTGLFGIGMLNSILFFFFTPWEACWVNGQQVGIWVKQSKFKPWLGSLCYVLGQDSSHSASLHPGLQVYKWIPANNCLGNLTKMLGVTCDGLALIILLAPAL